MSILTSIPKYLATYLTREGRIRHWDNLAATFFPGANYHEEVTLRYLANQRQIRTTEEEGMEHEAKNTRFPIIRGSDDIPLELIEKP
jgi:hypothetical protein